VKRIVREVMEHPGGTVEPAHLRPLVMNPDVPACIGDDVLRAVIAGPVVALEILGVCAVSSVLADNAIECGAPGVIALERHVIGSLSVNPVFPALGGGTDPGGEEEQEREECGFQFHGVSP